MSSVQARGTPAKDATRGSAVHSGSSTRTAQVRTQEVEGAASIGEYSPHVGAIEHRQKLRRMCRAEELLRAPEASQVRESR